MGTVSDICFGLAQDLLRLSEEFLLYVIQQKIFLTIDQIKLCLDHLGVRPKGKRKADYLRLLVEALWPGLPAGDIDKRVCLRST